MVIVLLLILSLLFASGSESLLYHLSELKGMASWKQKYEPLGLDATCIEGTDGVFSSLH